MTTKILIVDVDEFGATGLKKKLLKRGFEIDIALSGKACCEYLMVETPDLVLLDFTMPDMTAVEVLTQLRSVYTSIDLPVIVATANKDVSLIVECLRVGANDYMTKPVNIEIAEARIQSHILSAKNYRDALEKRELESLNKLVATYNHEINNPLTIAFGLVRKAKKEHSVEHFDKITEALNRITQIVKQIELITSRKSKASDLEVTQNMYKIR